VGLSSVPDLASLTVGDQADLDTVLAYIAAQPRRDYLAAAKASITGGGMLSVDSSFNIKWSQRFMLMGAGRGVTTSPIGYFQIDTPAAGVVITGVGGATNKTVVAAGVPLGLWDALYYILPLGASQASVPANFRVANYTSDFVVPDDWVLVAFRNSDASGTGGSNVYDEVFWCTGDHFTPWVLPALGGGWAPYGAPYSFQGFCKYNGMITMQGLVSGGTVAAGTLLWTMPAGFKPRTHQHFVVGTGTAPYTCILNVFSDGQVKTNVGVTAAWLGFDGVTYLPTA